MFGLLELRFFQGITYFDLPGYFFLAISCLALDENIKSLLICLLEMLQIKIGLLACKSACLSAFKSRKQACNTGKIYPIYAILALKMSKCIIFWTNIRLKIYSTMLALGLGFAHLLICSCSCSTCLAFWNIRWCLIYVWLLVCKTENARYTTARRAIA